MKIGICGFGYVGKAVYNFLKDNYDVLVYDILNSPNTKEEINGCDYCVICVPTPQSKDGSCDTSIVTETLNWLKCKHILCKSTIPPTFNPPKNLTFSPEYVGEGKYPMPESYPNPTDMKKHNFTIFGGEKEETRLWVDIFQKVNPLARYFQTDFKTASLVKYMENSWLATKVTFCNEFYDICDTFGVDYKDVRELWLLDGRIERSHTAVFPTNRGFSGKCFPKDTSALLMACKNKGFTPKLLNKMIEVNKDMNKKNETI
jgi:UDPglucose 6-dehydrogenase